MNIIPSIILAIICLGLPTAMLAAELAAMARARRQQDKEPQL